MSRLRKNNKRRSNIQVVAFEVNGYLFCLKCFNELGFVEYFGYKTNKDIANEYRELFCDRCGKQL